MLTDQSRTRLLLAIEDKADDALVGFAYLSNIDWFSRVAEFGILIGDRGRHGNGLARGALELMAGYAFDDTQSQQALLASRGLQPAGASASTAPSASCRKASSASRPSCAGATTTSCSWA